MSAACSLLLALAVAAGARADESRRLAVLEFELAPGVKIDRTYFSDLARGAVKKSVPQLFVMTRESTDALLQANGKSMADCTGECEVEVGRKLGADFIISGRITKIGSTTILTMRLFATADGSLVGDEEADAKSDDQLLVEAKAAVERLIEPLSAVGKPQQPGPPEIADVQAFPDATGALLINATMRSATGVFAPEVFWRPAHDQGPFKAAGMIRDQQRFQAVIETTAPGIEYFVEAFDEQGAGPSRSGSPEHPIEAARANAPASGIRLAPRAGGQGPAPDWTNHASGIFQTANGTAFFGAGASRSALDLGALAMAMGTLATEPAEHLTQGHAYCSNTELPVCKSYLANAEAPRRVLVAFLQKRDARELSDAVRIRLDAKAGHLDIKSYRISPRGGAAPEQLSQSVACEGPCTDGLFTALAQDGIKLAGVWRDPVSATVYVRLEQPAALAESEWATGVNKVEPKSGLEFVFMPGGSFHLGCEPQDTACANDEKPGRAASVGSFWLGKTDVTVAAYVKCVQAGACTGSIQANDAPGHACNWKAGRIDHPMNCIGWSDSQKFCAWAGGRLPSAEEWEFAAKGGESRIYPWGNEPVDGTRANYCDKHCPDALTPAQKKEWSAGKWIDSTQDAGYAATSPVGNYKAGAAKAFLLDMAGDVWQWTASDYGAGQKEIRGGSCYDRAQGLRTSARARSGPSTTSASVGFRCAL